MLYIFGREQTIVIVCKGVFHSLSPLKLSKHYKVPGHISHKVVISCPLPFPFNRPSPAAQSDKRLISTLAECRSSSRDKETHAEVMTARGRAVVLTPVMNAQQQNR